MLRRGIRGSHVHYKDEEELWLLSEGFVAAHPAALFHGANYVLDTAAEAG